MSWAHVHDAVALPVGVGALYWFVWRPALRRGGEES